MRGPLFNFGKWAVELTKIEFVGEVDEKERICSVRGCPEPAVMHRAWGSFYEMDDIIVAPLILACMGRHRYKPINAADFCRTHGEAERARG